MIFILPVFLYLSFDLLSFCLSLPYISSLFCLSFASSPESSILSWKAALSLFRYHLHINAARRLAGEHLMRRWQHHQIFAIVYHYFLLDIFPFVTLYDCPGHCSEWSTSQPGTSDKSAEVTIVLEHSPHSLLTCCTSPRMVISPVLWLVVLGCSYLLIQDIGPGLSLYTVGAQGKIGPHNTICQTIFRNYPM